MKTISLKLDAGLHGWLEQQAKRLGRTKSEIARRALEKSRAENPAPSCHDRMQVACGSLHSGVRDLATNKKHMKGFGEWKR
jgi:predicted transcriptional regulator